MQLLDALSLTLNVSEWLANSRHPRILHIFDHACNLINEHRDVLSIVTPQIGNGPFNLVIQDDILFSEQLNVQSPISIQAEQLHIRDLTIRTAVAKLWSPRPDWEDLHCKIKNVLAQLTQLQTANYQSLGSLVPSLSCALANADIETAKAITSQLAGLGQGLTPSGDDVILGAVLAVWIIHPLEIAGVLAKEVSNTAAPLTTSLSAAYLKSAGKGEAGILWHEFFKALITGDDLQLPITNLLAVGETSGADALAGFASTFISYAEREAKLCRS